MDGPPAVAPKFHLAQGDAVTWLRALPAESIDLVVTDPPYESLEKHRAIGTTTRLKHSKASSNDWFSIFPNERFPELFAEVYRVLRRNTHFYLFCDPETMFVAKPLGEAAGFKFWKPIVWDKCLGPDTLVWTERGTTRIADLVVGDRVALPEGGSTPITATRRTRARSRRLSLSDGTRLVASQDHRFLRADGSQCKALDLEVGDALGTRPVRRRITRVLRLADMVEDDDELSDPREVALDYDLGRLIGRSAAERSPPQGGVVLDGNATRQSGDHACSFGPKRAGHLVAHFVGGRTAPERYFKPSVYEAPAELRRGVLAGLLEGDGHGSDDEHCETYTSASPDLAMFVRRELEVAQRAPVVRRLEHEHAGAWQVRFGPMSRTAPLCVVGIEELGEQDLVDISVADRDELFLLANGVVTHNCKIGMGYHYRARYECILFFEKGKRKLNDLGIADILQAPRVSGGYPAEKPTSVSQTLITQSTEHGQLVIDPFMGSGSVGVAAVTSGRMFAGNDLCTEAVDITRARLVEAGATEIVATAAAPGRAVGPGQLGLGLGAPGASGGG